MDEMKRSLDATVKRFVRDYTREKRVFGYIHTAEGQAVASRGIERLSEFVKRELAHPALKAPDGLREVLSNLDPGKIALAGLEGLLNSIAKRKKDGDRRQQALKTTLAIGRELRFECLTHKILTGDKDLKAEIESGAA